MEFSIKKSESIPNYWECAEHLNHVVVTFEDKKFSETKNFRLLENNTGNVQIDKIYQEMESWLLDNHGDKVFDNSSGFS